MAIDSLFNSVMNMNQYGAQYTQQLLAQASSSYASNQAEPAGFSAAGSQGSNPLSELQGIGGAMPPYPREAAANIQGMQQQFADTEQMKLQHVESEVSANTDAYYASKGETPAERAARVQATDAAKEALQQQQDAQMADFTKQAGQQIQAAYNPNDPNSRQKVADLEQQIQVQAEKMKLDQQRAMIKVGVPPEMQGMADEKFAEYTSMQGDHQAQIQASPDYQIMQQYQQDMQTYLEHLKANMGNQETQYHV